MDISALFGGVYETQYAQGMSRDNRSKEAPSSRSSSYDTVTISEEAKALAAEMSARKAVEDAQDSLFQRNPNGESGEEDVAGGGVEGGMSMPGSEEAIGEQIEDLEAKIEKLNQQITAIMSGPGEPQEKMDRAQPLQQQVNTLTQELQALQAQLKKQSQSKA